MATQIADSRGSSFASGRSFYWLLLLAAPAAGILAGLALHWWDPRRALLLPVGFAVLATSFALLGERRGWSAFWASIAVGAATWAGAQVMYILAHIAAGEPLDAGRFGPQWAQALALIVAHALFLGIPTGTVAGLLLNVPPLRGLRLRPG